MRHVLQSDGLRHRHLLSLSLLDAASNVFRDMIVEDLDLGLTVLRVCDVPLFRHDLMERAIKRYLPVKSPLSLSDDILDAHCLARLAVRASLHGEEHLIAIVGRLYDSFGLLLSKLELIV
jgi:hypothetical protein